jgi:hypothetical protein
MTALEGRLLLDGLEEAVDCSRDDAGGVRCRGELRDPASCFRALTLMSWISTRSSSSSSSSPSPGLNAVAPLGGNEVSAATFSDHVPSGSIVTCSTESLVLLRMPSTYLPAVSMNIESGRDSLVDLQSAEGYRPLIADRAGPSWCLLLQLQKR